MTTATATRPFKGIGMEGWIAKWYAGNVGRDLTEYRQLAGKIAAQLPDGSSVLEVASGPGYLAIELARGGALRVSGLDISRSFIEIASRNASRAGVDIEFRHGNAAAMPFEEGRFDFLVCRAAFKNFTEPVRALSEMHRVLKPGGKALIVDLRHDAPWEQVCAYVDGMGLGAIDAFFTRCTFRMLIRRAYTKEQFRDFVTRTPFRRYSIDPSGIGLEVCCEK